MSAAAVDRKKKEKERDDTTYELLRSKKYQKELLVYEQPGSWSLILARDSKVLFSTQFALEVLGVTDSDVVDKQLTDFIHEVDRPSFHAAIDRLWQTSTDIECIIRFRHAAGSYRFVELRAAPYANPPSTELTCIVASGRLYPSLYVDVFQSMIDIKLENERLKALLEDPPPKSAYPAAAVPTPSASWDGRTPSTSLYDPSAPIPAHMPPVPRPSVPYVGLASHAQPKQPALAAKEPKKKKPRLSNQNLVCARCGRKDSPEWRKGPNRAKEFCNACGIRWAKERKEQPQSEPAQS